MKKFWSLMTNTEQGTETIITIKADTKDRARTKLIQIGIDLDKYDYLLEYKPPNTEYTPPGAKEELKQLLLLFGSNPPENKCKPEQKATQLFLF